MTVANRYRVVRADVDLAEAVSSPLLACEDFGDAVNEARRHHRVTGKAHKVIELAHGTGFTVYRTASSGWTYDAGIA